MTPTKKGDEKKSCSATREVVTRETPSPFASTSVEWVSRRLFLGHSKRTGNVAQSRWELHMCALATGSTKLCEPKG
ncbi:unnamed protein product [Gulo gulo]|uniref:Uncharacterized protein n=1 Tax=Gulo gulo TaxID=48420 RepID=A0A9X9Q9P7_GULGU|nr:unnamed protein product [Gulo gulo]